VLVFVAVALPAILGIAGLVFDVGLILATRQNLQHAADAAATAAAMDLRLDKTEGQAIATAENYLRDRNAGTEARATINIPPAGGSYSGRSKFVEVVASHPYRTRVMHLLGTSSESQVTAHAVAGLLPATSGAAVVVLDPSPPLIGATASLLDVSGQRTIGGLEVLGTADTRVAGAVLVNTTWGGVDEEGSPAGSGPGPPHGISCTPLLSTTRLLARDIRVVGGVDKPGNYGHFVAGQKSRLRANRLPVPDPFKDLPVPTTSSDPRNVAAKLQGSVDPTSLLPGVIPTVLEPGVYDWIEIIAGTVEFKPGVYIIRGVSPTTGTALSIVGGIVKADDVLFYVTNSAAYNPLSGAPDNADGEARPAPSGIGGRPSVVINAALLGSSFSPLRDPGSPFNGMIIYQRRRDDRAIVISAQGLLGSPAFQGAIYAKWGHVRFLGDGTYDMPIVAGTVRFVSTLGLTIAPSQLLPPAFDVFLVE